MLRVGRVKNDLSGPRRTPSFTPESIKWPFLEKRYHEEYSKGISAPLSGPALNLGSSGVNQTERLSYGTNKDVHCEPLQKQLT